MNAHATYALRLGDDALVLAQRLAEWSSNAPELEEDVALTNLALDLLGQARILLTHAGELEGVGRNEDDLAYLRDERDFVNCQLAELPNHDFAVTVARQLCFSAYQLALYERLESSTDPTLAGLAGKAVKEVAYHLDHATMWTLRLGDGTEESRRRMISGLDRVWPYTAELFDSDDVTDAAALAGIGVDPASLREGWTERIRSVLDRANLTAPDATPVPGGGRRGVHTESFGYLLAEMQHLRRSHPGADW